MRHGSDLNFCQRCSQQGVRTPVMKGERYCPECAQALYQERAAQEASRAAAIEAAREAARESARAAPQAGKLRGWGMALEIAGGIVGGLSVLGGLIWGQWVAVGAGVGLIVHVCWLSQWHGAAAEALDHLAAIRKALESRQ